MDRKKLTNYLALVLCSLLVFQTANAQTLAESTKTYNEAVQLSETDPAGAQRAMTELLPQLESLGDEGAELKGKVEKNIPSMQYKAAIKAYKAKELKTAIEGFESALALSKTYNNEDIPTKVQPQLPSLYYSYGRSRIKQKDKEGAMDAFNKSIAIDPSFAKSYYGKSMLYRNEQYRDSMFVYVDKAISLAGDNAKSVATFKKNTAKHLFSKGKSYNKSKKYKKAIAVLTTAMEKYIDASTKKVGKYHFELGKAHAGLNQKSKACTAYRKIKSGKYLEAAKYEIEHTLKCN